MARIERPLVPRVNQLVWWQRFLIWIAEAVLFPVYMMMLFMDEISGEAHSYRRHVAAIQERPRLSRSELEGRLDVEPQHLDFWFGIRHAVAESVGIDEESLYPEDAMQDLWRMQWLGPDTLDIVFRLEKEFDCVIQSPEALDFHRKIVNAATFHDFARCVIPLVAHISHKRCRERWGCEKCGLKRTQE